MAGESILIVDDTSVNLRLTQIILVNLGYRVWTASSAEDALEILRRNHPHLVLTDIHLPGMNGLELTRRIKSRPGAGGTLVVALAAFANPGEEQEALKAGCDGCIGKPVEPRSLGVRVREFLDHRRATAATRAETAPLADESDLRALRQRFLREARAKVRQWGLLLEREFDPEPAVEATHQWIGAAGLLAYPEVSDRARALVTALRARPIDLSELREALDGLWDALAVRQAEQGTEDPE